MEIDSGVEENKEYEGERQFVEGNKRHKRKHDGAIMEMLTVKEGETPQPYTCICFEDKFYTTDQTGFFLHKMKYYRCVTDEQHNIKFNFIRDLDVAEVCALQSLDMDEINVIKDLTTNNKSLLY